MLTHCSGDRDNKAGLWGESAKETAKTNRVRECRVISGATVVINSRVFVFHARLVRRI